MVVEVILLPPPPSQTTSTYQEKSVIKNVLRYPTKIKINYCFLEKKMPGSTSDLCQMCYHSY